MRKCCFSLLLALGVTGLSFGRGKISDDLTKAGSTRAQAKVIIQYAPGSQANSVVRNLSAAVSKLPGSTIHKHLSKTHALVTTVPVSALQNLAADPNVLYISPDRPLKSSLDYSAAAVNAQAAWQFHLTGIGIGVAIIDSGISPLGHEYLSNPVYVEDFTGGDGTDQYGHGTHVAGIVGSRGSKGHYVGIAPDARLLSLRVLDANGSGSDSTVIAAIERAIELKTTYNIRVINLSLGRPVYESYTQDPLCKAVEAAWKAGIVVVVAAGNDGRDNSAGTLGYGTIEAPGNDPYVITVGAMKAMETLSRTDDLVASYSSKGPSAIDLVVKPDIMAPGNHVISLAAKNSVLANEMSGTDAGQVPSDKFMMLNGTSMATPVVSGAVADILQAQPALTPDQVKARLMKTAYKSFPSSSTAVDPVTGQTFTSQYDILTVGSGYLDIQAAIVNQDLASGTAMSPTATWDDATDTATLVFDSSSVWDSTNLYGQQSVGGAGVWGSQTIWGTKVLGANRVMWGTDTMWGNFTVDANRVMWGTNTTDANRVMWGTDSTDASRVMWGTDSTTSDSDSDYTVQN